MFVCEKNWSCIGCNYQYADRLDQIDEEFRDCDRLIEVQEVKHGRYTEKRRCSNCGSGIPTDDTLDYIPREAVRYCYFCGARMDLQ